MYAYHIGEDRMFQDMINKQWYPATITCLFPEPRSYIITTRKGVNYRSTQAYLNPYQPKTKKLEDEHSVVQLSEQCSDMQTFKPSNCKKFDSMNNQVQSYSRPKRDIKPPVKPDL